MPVRLFLTGPARAQEAIKRIATNCLSDSAKTQDRLTTHSTGVQHQFDWSRPEALQHLTDALDVSADPAETSDVPMKAVVTYQHMPTNNGLSEFREGCYGIDALAKKVSAVFLLILVTEDTESFLSLADVATDLAVVTSCEPDPDCMTAFSIRWHGMEMFEPSGWGHSFVQAELEGSDFDYSVGTFCGEHHVDRLVHAGTSAGLSQKQIAEDLGVERYTVCRSLSPLKLCPSHARKAWYVKNAALFKAAKESRELPEEK